MLSIFVRREGGKRLDYRVRSAALSYSTRQMTAYKNAQQHVVMKGRDFHFVSYDGTPANEKRGIVETGPMWYLMLSLIHISEPTRLLSISYAVFCLKKKKT